MAFSGAMDVSAHVVRRIIFPLITTCLIYGCILALYAALEEQENSCHMTYMYPNYFPIAMEARSGMILNKSMSFAEEAEAQGGARGNGSKSNNVSKKYRLYLYREGWKHNNVREALPRLSGVPVLFVPGNGGSYRQVRSLAGESERLFLSGLTDSALYRKSSLTPEESAYLQLEPGESAVSQWTAAMSQNRSLETVKSSNRLDWFVVDFAEELSALDAGLAVRQTEFLVSAIDKILALYHEVFTEKSKQQRKPGPRRRLHRGKNLIHDLPEPRLPTSVLVVGHSMGGAIARAAVIHPRLKANSVTTVITLSSPHLAPVLASQPALVQWFRGVNEGWRQGFKQATGTHGEGPPILADMVIASIAGGTKDFQVRPWLAQFGNTVPPNSFVTAGTSSMPSVWLSADHLCIMWCHQLVVQVVKAVLRLIDPESRQLSENPVFRHAILAGHFRSSLPQGLGWLPSSSPTISLLSLQHQNTVKSGTTEINRELKSAVSKEVSESDGNQEDPLSNGECPPATSWRVEPQETDIFSDASMVTVTMLDGRRRWMNIQTWAGKDKDHFVLVTSLEPCKGIRVHLWPTRNLHSRSVPVEVTTRLLPLPSSSQKQKKGEGLRQPGPTGLLLLSPSVLKSFGFVTISIVPPPASSKGGSVREMVVAQFYKGSEASIPISNMWLSSTVFKQREIKLEEGHAAVLNMELGVNLGVVPLRLQCNATGCGQMDGYKLDPQIRGSTFGAGQWCVVGCFPPLAILWDPHSQHEVVIPYIRSELLVTDTPPATLRKPLKAGRSTSLVVFVLDPHCTYTLQVHTSLRHAALRFLISNAQQIAAMSASSLLFAMFHQSRAWELGQPMPSLLTSFSMMLQIPTPLILQYLTPLAIYLALGILWRSTPHSFEAVVLEALTAYGVATAMAALLGCVVLGLFRILLAMCNLWPTRLSGIPNKQGNIWTQQWTWAAVISFSATLLVHPVLGLLILLVFEIAASVASLHRCKFYQKGREQGLGGRTRLEHHLAYSTSSSVKSAVGGAGSEDRDARYLVNLNVFRHRHATFLLHMLAMLLLFPSFVAWVMGPIHTFTLPSFLDSAPCSVIMAHAILSSLDSNASPHPTPPSPPFGKLLPLSSIYAVTAVASFLSALFMSPSLVLYYISAVAGVMATLHMQESRKDSGTRLVWQLKGQLRHKRDQ